MKAEVGSFSVASPTVVLVLDDSSINVKAVHFQISFNNNGIGEASTGFSDGTKSRAKSLLITDAVGQCSRRSSIYSITHYKSVSGTPKLKIAGKVTDLSTPGEIAMEFDDYDTSITIDFIAIGE